MSLIDIDPPGIGGRAGSCQPIDAVAATEFWYGSTGDDLAIGLRQHGWNVHELDIGDFVVSGRSLPERLLSRATRPLTIRAFNRAILESIDQTNAKIFFTVKGSYINSDTLTEIGKRDVFRMVYYPDYHFDYPGFSESIFEHYDLIATTKSFQVDYLASLVGRDRVIFVPHGYSTLMGCGRRPEDSDAFVWDLCYIGNASKHKLSYLAAVADAFPQLRMIVVGNGWTKLAAGTPLERSVLGYPLVGDFLPRLVSRSRIAIAIHFGQSGAHGWEDLVSRRTFEIPAYGGFMLHIDNEEVRALYEVPDEIDIFSSPLDLVEKVELYLKSDSRRAEMAERAHRRAVPQYGLLARASRLDEEVRARLDIAGGNP